MVWFCSHRQEKAPAPIEYRKAPLTESGVYYTSSCNAAASKRSSTDWIISVVGAPEQKAVEILDIVHKIVQDKSVKLRWWCEGPPKYDFKSNLSGDWVYYNSDNCTDVPQTGSEVILLYYSNGCDPRALFENIPGGELMMYHPDRMLIPVCDYIFDKKSCKRVICSQYSPLYQIETGGSPYYAPVPILSLHGFSEKILQRGEEMRTLGEMNKSFDSFDGQRCARKEK